MDLKICSSTTRRFRDDAWAEEQFKLLGEIKYNQEVLCEFLGSTNTLISGKTLSMMSSKEIVYKKDGLDIYEEPQQDKYYVITSDTSRGIGGDFSAFIVVDITEMPFRVVGKFRDNKVSPLLYPDFIARVAKDYNNAYVLIENNDIGQQVVDILHQELEYENIFSTVQEKNKQYVSCFGKTNYIGGSDIKSSKETGLFVT